jgi:elongator complex protein 3
VSTFHFDTDQYKEVLLALLKELSVTADLDADKLRKIVKRFTKPNGDVFAKDEIIQAYRKFVKDGTFPDQSEAFVRKIQMKPTRTISGVTPVTVLTKPFPCPGKCIFLSE